MRKVQYCEFACRARPKKLQFFLLLLPLLSKHGSTPPSGIPPPTPYPRSVASLLRLGIPLPIIPQSQTQIDTYVKQNEKYHKKYNFLFSLRSSSFKLYTWIPFVGCCGLYRGYRSGGVHMPQNSRWGWHEGFYHCPTCFEVTRLLWEIKWFCIGLLMTFKTFFLTA